ALRSAFVLMRIVAAGAVAPAAPPNPATTRPAARKPVAISPAMRRRACPLMNALLGGPGAGPRGVLLLAAARSTAGVGGAGRGKLGEKVIHDEAGIVGDAVDDARRAPPQPREPDEVDALDACYAVVMYRHAALIDHRKVQP